ncbi:probable LRR receptor-like serine/threonine-protein kinase At1g56140 isoform X2 [Ipomoea triloba]|uniref:probable LRR receptor-like serine/threonine-protein kinase At1g56140 isoform X2 n=1 Tax=Ipomoea triloba TaxID=35885 RepID=UPI00125E1FB3|nr:probable LRR receptor-like serine/threonine-protein kinase At1g56140 isoform X2 [Ipomoea triloba]
MDLEALLSLTHTHRVLLINLPMEEKLLWSSGVGDLMKYIIISIAVVTISYPQHLPTALAQTTNATLDPSEARILNSIFQQWGIRANNLWNLSGELCSGAAVDSTVMQDTAFNPAVKCDCSSTPCHITALKVYALDVIGVIPDELWKLNFINDLDLGQNYLTDILSPAIANMSGMQYLSLGINALSGELPKELGLLTDLRSLSIGTNNFYGRLPSELGNLKKLTQLYIDSSGISGVIPPTFANLLNLEILWASDIELTGRIPDFIGNWSKLTTLRFEGNSFQGPIPSALSNLTSMVDLRISDLLNGSSSLDFIRNMKNLSKLILRNNNISGSIPSNIGEYQSLSLLFLGNNKLTGSLPVGKSENLQNIDLSYNEISGILPYWTDEQGLQLNLVSNYITIDSSSSRRELHLTILCSQIIIFYFWCLNFPKAIDLFIDNNGAFGWREGIAIPWEKNNVGLNALPSGLNCLQKNFSCRQGNPIYSSFAIKCGGQEITSSNQTVYERDNETLGPATHYMTSTGRWAVSNVGLPSDINSPKYTTFSSSQFTNTLDSELFQTARISAGSLRYYGLGLKNGNYIVTLHFAESVILNPRYPTWKVFGRRVFNIYIQGNLEEKDFDIQKAAGGSLRAVSKQYKVQVSENHMEIHLFWAGKGTCCVPSQGTYGPLISAISATPDFVPTVSNKPPSEQKKNRIVGIVVGVGVVSFLSAFAVYCLVQRRKRQDTYNDDEEFLGMDVKPYTFSYAELRGGTNDFSPSNKLGEGGFGAVYKGTLEDGRIAAVKQLSVASRHGKSQFVAEVATIFAVQHRNLVKLYGCCYERDKRLIVYEFLENKSLDQALFGGSNLYLDWPRRFEICLGIARGLAYLHEESRLRIVHRDIKASNILLNSDLNPKISDFGLAKLYDDKKTHISTRIAGTLGYLAPEYAMLGHLTEKADVFSFGIVALEIVSGRPNYDSSLEENKMYLLEWAWNLLENKREIDLVDENLSDFNKDEVKRVIGVSLLCTQTSPVFRPPMSRVVAMLSGGTEIAAATTRPSYLADWRFNDLTSFMTHIHDSQDDPSVPTTTRDVNSSPLNTSRPLLHEIIGEGQVRSI